MTGFAVKFLGCKVSQADAMLARSALLAAGHAEVPEAEADLHVINTCCITSEAESKSRQSTRRSLRHADQVIVAGCAVNLNARRFGEIDRASRRWSGPPTRSPSGSPPGRRTGSARACADTAHDLLWRRAAADGSGPAPTRTRGFVKVQDGCDCHCAYCIIPTVRGPARSRPVTAILDEVRRRVADGQPEMVMTGISVGDYRDPERGLELGDLMCEVARVPGVQRVRLSSVEVIHVKDSLLRALTDEPKVCPHLHVPMQSGDDAVLRDMGRHYDCAEYLEHIARLRRAAPDVNLTTDVIVGFPTEDEAAFERTLLAVDSGADQPRARVPLLAATRHPRRAARRPRRAARRRSAAGSCCAAARRCARDCTAAPSSDARLQVLIDKVADSQCSGYTADYTRCYLPAGAGGRGELVTVTARELHADGLRCDA